MLKQLIAPIVALSFFAACAGGEGADPMSADKDKAGIAITPDQLVSTIDPVCKMDMASFKITDTAHYNGNIHAFCSGHCKGLFKEEPTKYLTAAE